MLVHYIHACMLAHPHASGDAVDSMFMFSFFFYLLFDFNDQCLHMLLHLFMHICMLAAFACMENQGLKCQSGTYESATSDVDGGEEPFQRCLRCNTDEATTGES